MGKVIKRGAGPEGEGEATPPPLGRTQKRAPIIGRDRYEARADAQNIRDKAVEEADAIREQAQAEAEQLRQQAQEQGFAQGLEEGRAQGANELMESIGKLEMRAQQIEAQAVPQLKELAVSIARKILGKELEFHPDAVVDVVKQALSEKARQRSEVYLRVNPADLNTIREARPELIEVLSRAKEIGIREDPDVAPHGVVIETDAGTIDAQLETQLAVFENLLRNME